jgi:hypothetical protein
MFYLGHFRTITAHRTRSQVVKKETARLNLTEACYLHTIHATRYLLGSAILLWMCGENAMAPVLAPTLALPVVVLGATDTRRGIGGHQDERLVVRLAHNGKIEWGHRSPQNQWERQTDSVGAEEVGQDSGHPK